MPNYLYTAGTASVTTNSDVVTGVATAWSGVNVKPGDTLNIAGQSVIIAAVTDATHLKLAHEWTWAAAAGQPYTIIQSSPAWGQVRELSAAVANAINKLDVSARIHLSNGVPDNAYAVTHNTAIDTTATPPRLYVANGNSYTAVGYAADLTNAVDQLSFESRLFVKSQVTSLPTSPASGDSHIVKAGSPAPLDSKANKIAYYKDGSWLYYDPPVNVPIYMSAQNNYWRWSGATWEKDCLSNIKGFVFINADGSTTGTNGITSVAKTGTGQYTITTSMVSNQVKKYDWWDVFIPHTPGLGGKDVSIDSAGDKIWINVKDTAGAAVDSMLRVSFS